MIHEVFFPESPKSSSDKDMNEEDAILKIFSPNFEKMDIQEEEPLDYLIYLNNPQSCQLDKRICLEENQIKDENLSENGLLIIDDYESAFNKFAKIEETKNIITEKENINKPSFYLNLFVNENKFKSPIDENQEIIINMESQIQKNKKIMNEKIIEVVKEEKLKKKNEKNKVKLDLKKKNVSPTKKLKKEYCIGQVNTDDICFPFTSGKGVFLYSKTNEETLTPAISSLCDSSHDAGPQNQGVFSPPDDILKKDEENIKVKRNNNKGTNKGELREEKLKEETYDYSGNINTPNEFLFKFKTKKYFVAEDGKKKKVKKKRKFKPDDIRKKIKSRFHKTIKNIINENLKKAGSKELFDFLPQCFIGNVTKKANSKCFELTFKELLSTNFILELNKDDNRNSKVDYNKYMKNKKVLEYLEKNPDICRRSGFDLIKDRKYKDILKIYFTSEQFENSLIQLKSEKESPEYIQEYIKRARTYVSFYSSVRNNKDKKSEKDDDEDDDNEEVEEEEDEKINNK